MKELMLLMPMLLALLSNKFNSVNCTFLCFKIYGKLEILYIEVNISKSSLLMGFLFVTIFLILIYLFYFILFLTSYFVVEFDLYHEKPLLSPSVFV